MNTNDLYLEYARVIKMCEGTKLEDTPWVCVKLDGAALRDNYGHPGLGASIEKYEFAVAVLEGKPVFVGDTIYYKCDGEKAKAIAVDDDIIIVKYDRGESVFHPDDFTWTPPAPKRTFTLNGVGLPCPDQPKNNNFAVQIANVPFFFDKLEDAKKVKDALVNLLTEARDK